MIYIRCPVCNKHVGFMYPNPCVPFIRLDLHKCISARTTMWLQARHATCVCSLCNGTGELDSGGQYPWGEGIFVSCGLCDGTGRMEI